MTLQSDGNTLWVRCGSDDGTVAAVSAAEDELFITVTSPEDDNITLALPLAEAMMLGHWLIAAAKGRLPE